MISIFRYLQMALLITLDNVYKLYNLDSSKKTEGIVILNQQNDPKNEYTNNSRLFDGLLLGFLIQGSMKAQILSLGLLGLLLGLVQGILMRWTTPKLGEHKSVYFGLLFYALGLMLFAFTNQGWMMFVFLVPYSLGGICGPALQSIISKNVPANEQGELQGALSSLVSVTAILGPPIMTNLFYYFTHDKAPFQFSGAPFFLASILMFISAIIIYFAFRQKR
ncbi:MFS transporter [Sphingobacterium zeae]|uniref:MFS transporter n=1 Tax=Sphingobacterium zeae TaxID=1776859 RepID=UPI0036231181